MCFHQFNEIIHSSCMYSPKHVWGISRVFAEVIHQANKQNLRCCKEMTLHALSYFKDLVYSCESYMFFKCFLLVEGVCLNQMTNIRKCIAREVHFLSTAVALVVIIVSGVSATHSIQCIHSHFLLKGSSAHSDSVLTFSHNISRQTCN